MTVLEWKTPPAAPKQQHKLADDTQQIIEDLRSKPGEWALIKQDVNPNVTSAWKKRAGFEAKSSKIGKTNGKYDVYARYVGEQA